MKRDCLKCGRKFNSKGNYNRLCDSCRNNQSKAPQIPWNNRDGRVVKKAIGNTENY